VGLGSGAVHGFLLFFGAFVDQGVEVEVFDAAEGFFYEAAAAETPGSSHDFEGEGLFAGAFGGEFGHEGGEDAGVFLFFTVTDEIVGCEESEFEAVARGAGFSLFGARARGFARVPDEVVCVCDHVLPSFRRPARRPTFREKDNAGAYNFYCCSFGIVLKIGEIEVKNKCHRENGRGRVLGLFVIGCGKANKTRHVDPFGFARRAAGHFALARGFLNLLLQWFLIYAPTRERIIASTNRAVEGRKLSGASSHRT
jgi:hypothetical protein